ncbi:unnamed protein product [Pleuronectes platessa]|uniref:Uncharacterized protein n=1 Tax=Pleuronectes platessa TaxID=8262 RepID=A0A9N7VN89_PLEPL|nr:unnamed protein product [Pleuronectes platessa]
MARGRGGWLKQKWQEDHLFPDTRVFLLERKETEKWRGGEKGPAYGKGDRGDSIAQPQTASEPPAAFTQPHLSQSTLIRTIWLKDEPPAINASSKDSSTVSPVLTLSNI